MKYLKLFENFSDIKKGTISVSGKVITISGVGEIDYTGLQLNTDVDTMMPEFYNLLIGNKSNVDKSGLTDFIKNNLMNFSGQYLFSYDGRLFVLVKIKKWVMPFYFSSKGTSGKKIDWHYVFGVDTKNDWIIKGGVLPSGEMYYDEWFHKNYQSEIDLLELTKAQLRKYLNITEQERDSIVLDLQKLSQKYNKTIDSMFKGFDVIKGYDSDGVNVNDNYNFLLNAHLSILKHN